MLQLLSNDGGALGFRYPKAFQIVVVAVFFDYLFGPEAERAALSRMEKRQEYGQTASRSAGLHVGAGRESAGSFGGSPGSSTSSSASSASSRSGTSSAHSTNVETGFSSAAEVATLALQSRAHALMTQSNKVPNDVVHYVQYLEGKKAVLERKTSLLSEFLVGKGFNVSQVLTSSSAVSNDAHVAKRPRFGGLSSSPSLQSPFSASQGTPTQIRRQLTSEQMRKVQMNRALAMQKKELRKRRAIEQQRLAANAARLASPRKP